MEGNQYPTPRQLKSSASRVGVLGEDGGEAAMSNTKLIRDGKPTVHGTHDARIVGILFIVASAAAILGGSLAALPLDDADYLHTIAGQDTQVIGGVLLLVVQTIAVVGVAVMLFPVLRGEHNGLALGYVAARIIEGVLVLGCAECPCPADLEPGQGRCARG